MIFDRTRSTHRRMRPPATAVRALLFVTACVAAACAPVGQPEEPAASSDAAVADPPDVMWVDALPPDPRACYGAAEFPTAYCDEGTLCDDGLCVAAPPCTEVVCDAETLVCFGAGCEAGTDSPDAMDSPPPPPDPMDPPPPPPPAPPPAPTAPDTTRLKVRLDWDSAGDMDLHLLNPTATQWQRNSDCHYANCEGVILEWGVPGAFDDPRLSRDVTTRRGPERIVIDHPQPGVYRIGVNAFDGRSNVTVRIECGNTPQVRVLGPVNVGGTGEKFWRVADVEMRAGGSCAIRPISPRAGRPRDFGRR